MKAMRAFVTSVFVIGLAISFAAQPAGAQILDADGDSVPDATDTCVNTANTDQMDSDVDGVGDACDLDPYLGYRLQRRSAMTLDTPVTLTDQFGPRKIKGL